MAEGSRSSRFEIKVFHNAHYPFLKAFINQLKHNLRIRSQDLSTSACLSDLFWWDFTLYLKFKFVRDRTTDPLYFATLYLEFDSLIENTKERTDYDLHMQCASIKESLIGKKMLHLIFLSILSFYAIFRDPKKFGTTKNHEKKLSLQFSTESR